MQLVISYNNHAVGDGLEGWCLEGWGGGAVRKRIINLDLPSGLAKPEVDKNSL